MLQHPKSQSITSRYGLPQETILPCPFCSHQTEDLRDALHPTGTGWRKDSGFRHYLPHKDSRAKQGDVWSMNCLEHEGGCGASITGNSREETISSWNRRMERSLLTVIKPI